MVKYVFRDGPLTIKSAAKADPQAIGEALAAIGAKTGGMPEPAAIVTAAQNKRHPLHPYFEWDDKKLAHAARLDQARLLIRIIKVEDAQTGETEPAYVNISTDKGRAYHPIADIKRSAELQMAVLKQARRDLDAWTMRYRSLQELCAEVAAVRDKIEKRINENETRDVVAA